MPDHAIRFRIFEDSESACAQVAAEICQLIRERAILDRPAVIGLASGRSHLPLYEELIYLHREEGLCFKNVITFSLGEYQGVGAKHPLSCQSSMKRDFFDHVNIPETNNHFLDGNMPKSKVKANCASYEKKITAAGGIDLLILGIGRNGHIGFNEPETSVESRTAPIKLAEMTRSDAIHRFQTIENVPSHAYSLGCAPILEARRIILMAWGAKKARIVRQTLLDPISPKIPASYLQAHPAAKVYLDEGAASLLSTPE